jgi:hypothetical protein
MWWRMPVHLMVDRKQRERERERERESERDGTKVSRSSSRAL